jgi:hypothetical protein
MNDCTHCCAGHTRPKLPRVGQAQNAPYLYPEAFMNYTNVLQSALESLVAGGLRRRAPPLHPKVTEPGGGENKFSHARGPNKKKSACILGVCVWCIRFRRLFFEGFCGLFICTKRFLCILSI